MQKSKSQRIGFTLVELLVVMAIISILASIVTYGYINAIDKSFMTRALADIRAIDAGLAELLSDAGRSDLDQIFNPDGVRLAALSTGRVAAWPPTTADEFLVAQSIYTTALYGLIRGGSQMIGDTDTANGVTVNYDEVIRPEIMAKLGLGYVPDLSHDPWGNLYNIYPGPWRVRADTPDGPRRMPVPFRVFAKPEGDVPGPGGPDALSITAANAFDYEFTDSSGNLYGATPGLEVVSLPAPINRIAFVWSNGGNGLNSQALYDVAEFTSANPDLTRVYDIATQDVAFVGGGDDINNWDTARSFEIHY